MLRDGIKEDGSMSNTYLDKEGLTHFVDALNKRKIGNVSNDEGGN